MEELISQPVDATQTRSNVAAAGGTELKTPGGGAYLSFPEPRAEATGRTLWRRTPQAWRRVEVYLPTVTTCTKTNTS